MFKTCTGSKKCKKKNKPGSSKTCTGSNICNKCKTQMQCQRSGLDWSGFLHLLHLFEPVQVLKPWMFKTCTGSKKCKTSKPESSFYCICFEPVQVLEPWMFKTCTGSKKCKTTKPGSSKTCTGSKNAKNPNLEAPKPAQAQKKCKNAKPRCNVRSQGLIGLDVFFIVLHVFEPVQVLELSGLDLFAFF